MLFFSSHFRNAVKCQDSVNSYHRNYRKKSKNHFDFVGVCLLVSKPYEDKLGPIGSILSAILYWTFNRYFSLVPFEMQRFWVGTDGILTFYRISEMTGKKQHKKRHVFFQIKKMIFRVLQQSGCKHKVATSFIQSTGSYLRKNKKYSFILH